MANEIAKTTNSNPNKAPKITSKTNKKVNGNHSFEGVETPISGSKSDLPSNACANGSINDSEDLVNSPVIIATEQKRFLSDDPDTVTVSEVAWNFVEQYYSVLNKNPKKAHMFYKSKSALLRGNESEETPIYNGQKSINERLMEIGYKNCKVRITNIDCMPSVDRTMTVLVLGQLSLIGKTAQRFAQTFVLHEMPNGFYILNDIFRFLNDPVDENVNLSTSHVNIEIKDGEFKGVHVENVPSSSLPNIDNTVVKGKAQVASTEVPVSGEETKPTVVPNGINSVHSENNEPAATLISDSKPSSDSNSSTEVAVSTKNSKKKKNKASKKRAEAEEVVDAEVDPKDTKGEIKPQPSEPEKLTALTQNAQDKPIAWAKVVKKDTPVPTEVAEKALPEPPSYAEQHKFTVCLRFVKDDTPKSLLNEAFSKFGTVRSIDFNRGTVFLEFVNSESATKAVATGQVVVNGREIQVEPRRPRQPGHKGFYNRKGNNYNQNRNYNNSNSPTNSNDSSGGWTTPRPAGRHSGYRGTNNN